jgi:hypothetical protein
MTWGLIHLEWIIAGAAIALLALGFGIGFVIGKRH